MTDIGRHIDIGVENFHPFAFNYKFPRFPVMYVHHNETLIMSGSSIVPSLNTQTQKSGTVMGGATIKLLRNR